VNKKVKMPLLHISPLSFSLGFFCSFFPFFLLVLLHPFPILQLPFVARSLLVLESVANLHFDEMRSCCCFFFWFFSSSSFLRVAVVVAITVDLCMQAHRLQLLAPFYFDALFSSFQLSLLRDRLELL